jgi:hypothetical protein
MATKTKAELLAYINANITTNGAKEINAIKMKEILTNISDSIGSISLTENLQPKRYKALISQSETDAPTAIVLENTLGILASDLKRYAPGVYYVDKVFDETKTFYNPIGKYTAIDELSIYIDNNEYGGSYKLYIITLTSGDINNSNMFIPILIEVYD